MCRVPPVPLPEPSSPTARGSRRTAVVALAPVLASAVALVVYTVVARVVDATDQPSEPDVVDLGPAVAVLLGGGTVAAVVWAVGLRVVVGTLFPAAARTRVWWQLVGAGVLALVVGGPLLTLALPVHVPFGGWLLQQAALALVAVRADRRIALAETVPPGP